VIRIRAAVSVRRSLRRRCASPRDPIGPDPSRTTGEPFLARFVPSHEEEGNLEAALFGVEVLRREDHVRRAVAPAVLQAVEERSFRESGEPLGGDRRAGHVSTQALEPPAVPGRDGHVGVQAHAAGARAALAFGDLEVVDVDAVAGLRSRRHNARRGAAPPRRASPFCVIDETAALEQALDPPRHLAGDPATSASSGGGSTRKRRRPSGVRA
jgi:hypothetical protein